MHLYFHTVHLDEETLRVFFLWPTITHNLPFLHNLNVSLSAVWEGVGSMEVEELRRKNAPGVGINRGGELVDLCYQRCSDDLNINLLLLAELLDRAINLRSLTIFVDLPKDVIPRTLDTRLTKFATLIVLKKSKTYSRYEAFSKICW